MCVRVLSIAELKPLLLHYRCIDVREPRGRSRHRAGETYGATEAWSGVTEEPADGFSLFILPTPGANMMEEGEILREASED